MVEYDVDDLYPSRRRKFKHQESRSRHHKPKPDIVLIIAGVLIAGAVLVGIYFFEPRLFGILWYYLWYYLSRIKL